MSQSLLILVLRPRRLREQEALVLIKCRACGSHFTGHLLRRQTKIISDRASVDTRAVSCGGANTVTERSCAAPISKVERHISDRFCAIVIVWCSVNTYSARRGSKYEGARTGTH